MLSTTEYRELLAKAVPAATDADTEEPRPQTFFTPHQHRRALDANVSIVQGGRGVGKTWWFRALQNEQLRKVAMQRYDLPELDRLDCVPGFGTLRTREYPGPRVLHELVEQHRFEPEDIWTAVALHGFGFDKVRTLADWEARTRWVQVNPADVEEAFLELDERRGESQRVGLLLFDALDRLHSDRSIADRLTNGLLRLALTLRTSTRNMRAKVFIRHDMFESAGGDFPDASKLTNNMVVLEWDAESLYSLLFHLMCTADADLGRRFAEEANWREGKEGSAEELTPVLHLIASEYMGKNYRKGRTYSWIPKHLADGHGQASPRSFLSALGQANERSKQTFADHEPALHWDAIREGVQHASEIRVREVAEDTPWVKRALDPLRGQQVPIEVRTVKDFWSRDDLVNSLKAEAARTGNLVASESRHAGDDALVPTGPTDPDPDRLILDLKDYGIFTERADGRLDLPDVYRIAFGVGRKGGVPLVRR